jgi:two-component system chemotaxis sensor kinase CheA
MEIDFEAILQVFRAEAAENLAAMEDALLALEARSGDPELLDTVFRVAHTLKGDGSNLGLSPIAEFAHRVEDLLDGLREHAVQATPAVVGLLLEAVDHLRELVPAAIDGAEEIPPAGRDLLERIARAARGEADAAASIGGAAGADSVDSTACADFAAAAVISTEAESAATASAEAVASTESAATASAEAAASAGSIDIAESAVSAAPAVSGASTESAEEAAGEAWPFPALRKQAARTLRVDVGKLDRTLDLVGEIAIARGRVAQMLEDGRPAAEVLEAYREADRLHMDLQEVVMKLRMVPLGPTFRPHTRTVRDLALACGKQARLVVHGEDVEVDTSVVEHLRDPLTHLVRNAVDHGIEDPAARVAAGKEAAGTLTLSARHEGGTIAIRLTDDGAGLDRARILARARARGMAVDERMTDAEVFRLVFEAGFSTAAAVTELSGRGVGLDVVRRALEPLRGSVSLASRPGEGTTVTLRLPLTLAVIEGFAVGVGRETYVLPLDNVVECLELPAARHESAEGGVFSLRGQPMPYVRLRDFFGEGGRPPRRENVVVVRGESGTAGLVVDELLGESQAVIKPLGELFRGLRAIAGSTILGSGRVALILDLPTVLDAAVARHAAAA